MTTVKEAIEHLQGYNPEDHVALAVWQVEDVLERAKERKQKVTREQAEGIIDTIDRRQDASLGISWDTLDYYLDELK